MEDTTIKNKFYKYNTDTFYEIYCIIISFITILAWQFSYVVFGSIAIVVGIVALLLFKDFKYIIPTIFAVMFGYSTGFNIHDFPITLIVIASIFIIICIGYTIKNRRKFEITKHLTSFSILTLLCLIPILWNHKIPEGQEVLYFMNFTWLLYLVIYVMFSINLKKNSFKHCVTAFSYLGLVISCQLFLNYIESIMIHGVLELGLNDMIGWGIFNEAGIMLCFVMPFYFIRLINTNSVKRIVGESIKLLIVLIAIIISSSRGTYLFGGLEFIILVIIYFKFANKKKTFAISFGSMLAVALVAFFIIFDVKTIGNIIEDTFTIGLSDNGRFWLWGQAIIQHKNNLFVSLFGNGLVNQFYEGFSQTSPTGYDSVYMVYHSSLFQTLAAFGIVGVITLIWHIAGKYSNLGKLDKPVMLLLGAGYIIVDLYGLIDNTYGMFYYMIPLTILMVFIEGQITIDYKRDLLYK